MRNARFFPKYQPTLFVFQNLVFTAGDDRELPIDILTVICQYILRGTEKIHYR
jgi:hypothetical protein